MSNNTKTIALTIVSTVLVILIAFVIFSVAVYQDSEEAQQEVDTTQGVSQDVGVTDRVSPRKREAFRVGFMEGCADNPQQERVCRCAWEKIIDDYSVYDLMSWREGEWPADATQQVQQCVAEHDVEQMNSTRLR